MTATPLTRHHAALSTCDRAGNPLEIHDRPKLSAWTVFTAVSALLLWVLIGLAVFAVVWTGTGSK